MSKKVQLKVKGVSNTIKKKGDLMVEVTRFSFGGSGWTVSWQGEEIEAPFEVNKEDRGTEAMMEFTFKNQTSIEDFNKKE